MQDYEKAHQETIGMFLIQMDRQLMEKSEIETKLPRSFLQLHEVITLILRDNDLLPVKEEEKPKKGD